MSILSEDFNLKKLSSSVREWIQNKVDALNKMCMIKTMRYLNYLVFI